MQSLLGLAKNVKPITIRDVLRQDVLTWLIVVAVMSILFWAITQLVLSATIQHDQMSENLAQGALGGYRLFIVGFLGCLLIVRSKGIRLWTTYIVSAILYAASHGLSLSEIYTGNSLLAFMLVVVAVLSIECLLEYIKMDCLVTKSVRRCRVSLL